MHIRIQKDSVFLLLKINTNNMIHIKKILDNKDFVIENLKKRNIDFTNQINNAYDKAIEKNNLKLNQLINN